MKISVFGCLGCIALIGVPACSGPRATASPQYQSPSATVAPECENGSPVLIVWNTTDGDVQVMEQLPGSTRRHAIQVVGPGRTEVAVRSGNRYTVTGGRGADGRVPHREFACR
jgi:hypothetical protein